MESLKKSYKDLLEFVQSRKKGAEQVIGLLTSRINAELQYSKAMQQVATSPFLLTQGYAFSEGGTFHQIGHSLLDCKQCRWIVSIERSNRESSLKMSRMRCWSRYGL